MALHRRPRHILQSPLIETSEEVVVEAVGELQSAWPLVPIEDLQSLWWRIEAE